MRLTIFFVFVVFSNTCFSQDALNGIKLSELFFDIPLDSSINYWVKKIDTDSNLIKISTGINYYRGNFKKHKYIKHLGWSNYVSIGRKKRNTQPEKNIRFILLGLTYHGSDFDSCLTQFKILECFFKTLFDNYEFNYKFIEENIFYEFIFYGDKLYPLIYLKLNYGVWKEYKLSCYLTIEYNDIEQ